MLQKRQIFRSSHKYEHAAKIADEAISEAVARHLHEAILEKEERQEGSEGA